MSFLIQKPETGQHVVVWDTRQTPARLLMVLPNEPSISPNQWDDGIIFAENGRIILQLQTANVSFTQIDPNPPQAFSGNTNDLVLLLSAQFFYKCCSSSEMSQLWKLAGNVLLPTGSQNTVKIENTLANNTSPILETNNRDNNTGDNSISSQPYFSLNLTPNNNTNAAFLKKYASFRLLSIGDTKNLFVIPMEGLQYYGELTIQVQQDGQRGFANRTFKISGEIETGIQKMDLKHSSTEGFTGGFVTQIFADKSLIIKLMNPETSDYIVSAELVIQTQTIVL